MGRRHRAGRDRARVGQPAPRLDPPFAGNAQPLQRAPVRLSEEPLLLRARSAGWRWRWAVTGWHGSVMQPDGERLVEPVAHAGRGTGYLSAISLSWRDDEPRGGAWGRALRSGEPVVCEDIAEDSGEFFWRDDAMSRAFAAWVCLPLPRGCAVWRAVAWPGRRPMPDARRGAPAAELADNLASASPPSASVSAR